MNDFQQFKKNMTRRGFLLNSGVGLGVSALSGLLPKSVHSANSSGGTHHKATAKRVIFLFMGGAPSQIDLFDPKPALKNMYKQHLPESVSKGQRVTAMTKGKDKLIVPPVYDFAPKGQSGIMMSELLPHISKHVDDICFIRSMKTEAINHDPGKTSFCTGSEIPGKPSMGAWLSYGLGTMNKDLPDFIVLSSAYWGGKVNVQALYTRLWGSGFLPSKHQGASFQVQGDPVLFLSNPKGVDEKIRRRMLDTLGKINQQHYQEIGDPEIMTTIAQQEMAFRMQSSVPELTDIRKESEATLSMYGPEVHKQGSFARNCLLARKMAERDVRFIQLFHRGWDHHSKLKVNLKAQCLDVDQPISALLTDLKQRGLLDDTLVVFSGEFGRTVYGQGNVSLDKFGRDHHPRCFTTWMAGGGAKGGHVHGATDDFCYNIIKDPVHVRDFHATMLHMLGVDHMRLSFPFQGLDQRLTGVEKAHVIHPLLA